MSDSVRSGPALLEQVAATRSGDDRFALWWLGQSGYLFRWRDLTVCVDPYLSDALAAQYHDTDTPHERRFPPPFDPAALTSCDLVLITHRHGDHFDPPTVTALLAASPQALLVLPAPLADYAADELNIPDERLVPIRDGERFALNDLRIHAIAAAHERLELDAEGNVRCLSYVLQTDLVSLFVTGDTVPYPGQEARLAEFSPQVALVPINGRDVKRQALGVAGSLTIAEAARLAEAVGAEVAIPNHYGLFAVHDADPQAFVRHVTEHMPRLKPVVLEPGARWFFPPVPA